MNGWDDATPIYRQIKSRVERDILNFKLTEGDLVDSVRQMAVSLQVNPLTVAKAYQELADEGYLDKQVASKAITALVVAPLVAAVAMIVCGWRWNALGCCLDQAVPWHRPVRFTVPADGGRHE